MHLYSRIYICILYMRPVPVREPQCLPNAHVNFKFVIYLQVHVQITPVYVRGSVSMCPCCGCAGGGSAAGQGGGALGVPHKPGQGHRKVPGKACAA